MSIRKMASSDLAVWMTRTELAGEPDLLARYVALLSDAECERHAAFRSERARHHFLVGRALVRYALSQATGELHQVWRFTADAFGRPRLASPPDGVDLRFNLSHTDGLIACVVATGRDVGIDVECRERPAPFVALARRFFSPREAERVLASSPSRRRTQFYELWTLKESYLKALGTGIDERLSEVSFHIADRISIETADADESSRWRFWLMNPTPAHTLALTAEFAAHEPAEVRLRHVVPLAA